ncbi:glycoside hydrolase family 3 C-terminal domain-containing protein [Paenibacillus planticolens]|uniref:Glycoside hydrolase family 3 protein n=1 Tax=Paenibacillus planticolens TaxID=2654976 RepID=A0ABX1ZFR3_9BACL|nr:glycoside hydrolase family 3 C-terminal domain-containing protein [Paenibacillus planticolens]NOU98921.1 glycoside hydrolase family 3 protein [Paenibacillus planticolens]
MSRNTTDHNTEVKERAKTLVSQMTLDEKISQMLYNAAEIPRLGLPRYNWWNEALHGVARAGVATVFPQAIGLAASFDVALVERIADIIASEGRAKHHEFQRQGDCGIYKGLTFWSPNVNIFRDPRWGRGHETYGEDPYLTGRLGVAYIKGLQGDHPLYLKAAACAKHFAVHSGPEEVRHSFNAIVSKKDLYETYLPAFRDCVIDGHVEAVMGAYNRVNGEPSCGSETLLKQILRGEWGFRGHVVSDCWAIKDFHEHHHVTRTVEESAALALNNGCDLNCGNVYLNLKSAYEQGLITEQTIDISVTRLMETRIRLGLLDDEKHVPYTSIPYEVVECEEHLACTRLAAEKSMVLLKNQDGILPLKRDAVRSIAVIGPNADSRQALVGNYCGTASQYYTVLDGIREAVQPGTRIYYAEGCHLYKDRVEVLAEPKDRFAEALSAAERADVVVICLGLDASLEGEEGDVSNEYASGDRKHLQLPGLQQDLLETIHEVGKPVILVLLSGSAIAVNWADEHVEAIVQAWYPGAEGGRAVASLLFGDCNPSGRLPVTFYRSVEELPDFCDYSMENRTYRYMMQEALYPFGYGLSYTTFQYERVDLEKMIYAQGQSAYLNILVKNAGNYAGEETVQLYLKALDASFRTPNWQLKGFRKVFLEPGEECLVIFCLTDKELALVDEEGAAVVEPVIFEAYIGGSQPDSRSIALTGRSPVRYRFEIQ